MEKLKYGKELLSDLKEIKAQLGKERSEYINNKLKSIILPSGEAHACHNQLHPITLDNGKPNNERAISVSERKENNEKAIKMLSWREEPFVHHFNENDDISDEEVTFKIPDEEVTKLPFVKQLPRSITWVFTNRNQLMAPSDSVVGKKQYYYVNGEAEELSPDKIRYEEERKQKLEFSEGVDRIIREIGQKYSLDDMMVRKTTAKFLDMNVSDTLERYNELNKLNSDGDFGEVSDRSKSTSVPATAAKYFCRRCLIFACHLHEEYQQPLPREKKSYLFERDDVDAEKPCSNHCYLKLRSIPEADHVVDHDNSISNNKGKNVVSEMSQKHNEWSPVDKDCYLQGVEIFGRNSCLITRNVLPGHKTCLEVYNYMREQDQTLEIDNQVNKEKSQKKTKLARGAKQKNASYTPAIRNSAKELYKTYMQYTPCTCETVCGVECSCLSSGNSCEKYCGCLKICKNRFKGCKCAKGQCINKKCFCVSVSRECDSDLCRNCSLSCGDGTLGEASQPSQCKNMQFLLKKRKKILLAVSDVHGWGVFTRHSLKKDEFLGEYTGELVTLEEAEERGRADIKNGFSYNFSLNDKFSIDARRKGNKLRFLNHASKNPNCYAKLMTVRGDHRIGLFADKNIGEGEELVFDYGYQPGQAD